ncbi:MAG: hypothetical protein G01um101493_166 [Microgenomates group bacterium Gr01-1014_93]|nr:MAG: hypothetical protein G01um101493_166 [Microgenomates group bacterium Gr01-1014_93]
MKRLVIYLLDFYQRFLSFDHGFLMVFAPNGACRYPLSCSEYTKQAIIRYGILKGGWIGAKRLLSCNPWN